MTQANERAELLHKIFENANTWLQFAEAKNAALIAFDIAVIAALVGFDLLKNNLYIMNFLIIGFLVSTILAVWSFKPVNQELKKPKNNGVTENLMHYAYIATLERDEYLQKLYNRYWATPNVQTSSVPQLEKDYGQEIIENARITLRKQKYFKWGFYIVLFMLCALGVSIVCA